MGPALPWGPSNKNPGQYGKMMENGSAWEVHRKAMGCHGNDMEWEWNGNGCSSWSSCPKTGNGSAMTWLPHSTSPLCSTSCRCRSRKKGDRRRRTPWRRGPGKKLLNPTSALSNSQCSVTWHTKALTKLWCFLLGPLGAKTKCNEAWNARISQNNKSDYRVLQKPAILSHSLRRNLHAPFPPFQCCYITLLGKAFKKTQFRFGCRHALGNNIDQGGAGGSGVMWQHVGGWLFFFGRTR